MNIETQRHRGISCYLCVSVSSCSHCYLHFVLVVSKSHTMLNNLNAKKVRQKINFTAHF